MARLGKLTRFASAQVLVQALGFAAGLLILRSMSQSEYGHYTLVLTMIGLATALLDLGLMAAVSAAGGPWHSNPGQLRFVLADAERLQRRLAWAALLLLPAFMFMLLHQGLSAASAAVLLLLVVVVTALQLCSNRSLAVVRLRGDVQMLQKLDVGVNLIKLLMVAVASTLLLTAPVAIFINAMAAGLAWWMLKRHLVADIGPPVESTGEFSGTLARMVRQQAPLAIYQSVSGQLTIWLISVLGSADKLAEVGALGRLAVFFTIIGSVFAGVVHPYFARFEHARDMVKGFIAVNGFFGLLTLLLFALAVLFPQILLWILGPKYSHLEAELVWMVLASCFTAWGGTAYGIGGSRGWFFPARVAIPVSVSTLVISVWVFDVSTVLGNLMLSTTSAVVMALLSIGFVVMKLRQSR